MKSAVIIQARLKSERLPRKILSKIKDVTVIQHCMRALKLVNTDLHILLCDYYSFKELEPYAIQEDYNIFCGPEHNVLKRFALATKYFELTTVVRANGDNPLVSADIANEAIKEYKKSKADYFRFEGEPKGTGVEVINSSFIRLADEIIGDSYNEEHVAREFAQNNNFSTIKYVEKKVPKNWEGSNIRVTVDTEEDYKFVSSIFEDLYTEQPIELGEVIEWYHENSKDNSTEKL